jgi:hypothetical protein
MLSRTSKFSTVLARKFSSETPKARIARNLLRLSQIQNAKDENELKKIVASPLPTVDLKHLPGELAALDVYFAASSTVGGTFVADKTAWQNRGMLSVAAEEATRSENWPFIVGFL